MATAAEKIAKMFATSTQTEINPTFTLGKKAKKLVVKGAAAAQMGRLQAAESRRRKEEKAAEAAVRAAERRANFETFKAEFTPTAYLTVEGRVYHFPKTPINPRLFAENCVRLGLTPEIFKLSAVKPRKSMPIESADFRGAFWAATRTIPGTKQSVDLKGNPITIKKFIWFTLKSAEEVIAAVHPSSLGIWYERQD